MRSAGESNGVAASRKTCTSRADTKKGLARATSIFIRHWSTVLLAPEPQSYRRPAILIVPRRDFSLCATAGRARLPIFQSTSFAFRIRQERYDLPVARFPVQKALPSTLPSIWNDETPHRLCDRGSGKRRFVALSGLRRRCEYLQAELQGRRQWLPRADFASSGKQRRLQAILQPAIESTICICAADPAYRSEPRDRFQVAYYSPPRIDCRRVPSLMRPFVLGRGKPYFARARPLLRLVASVPVAEDTVRLTYVPPDERRSDNRSGVRRGCATPA